MTIEEAGELILAGKDPWVRCANWCTCGWLGIGTPELRMCPICDGYANTLSMRYAQACKLLDLPYPERTAYHSHRLTMQEIIEKGETAFVQFEEDKTASLVIEKAIRHYHLCR